MERSIYSQKALERFGIGYNCTQSVFAALSDLLGLDEERALKISSTFGGGMGMGSVCGALTGAMMALGLGAGISRYSPEAKDEIGALNAELVRRWREEIKAIDCRDILGIDPTDPVQKQAAQEAGIIAQRCPRCVESATRITQEMLHELDVI